MGEMGAEAKITYLPIHSGDGYGYGGGTILTIGDLSFNFGEGPKAKAIAEEIVIRWSRDAEDEIVEALRRVTASLVAAHSLLSRGSKKAAPSDRMFDQMLIDYQRAIDAGRAALSRHGEGK